jgi:hypothetical protein
MHRVPKSMPMHFFVSLLYWKPLLNYSCDSQFSVGLDMAQAVSRRLLTAEARVQFQASQCGFYGGQSGIGTGFSPSTSVSPVSIITPMLRTHSLIYHRRCIMFFSQYFSFPCRYHSTTAPYSFIHLPPTLYNVFLPALQFPPVSNIPLMFHTYSSVYHRRCIISAIESLVKQHTYFNVILLLCYVLWFLPYFVFGI